MGSRVIPTVCKFRKTQRKTTVTCKIKHLQKCCNVLVFYFTLHVTPLKCFANVLRSRRLPAAMLWTYNVLFYLYPPSKTFLQNVLQMFYFNTVLKRTFSQIVVKCCNYLPVDVVDFSSAVNRSRNSPHVIDFSNFLVTE